MTKTALPPMRKKEQTANMKDHAPFSSSMSVWNAPCGIMFDIMEGSTETEHAMPITMPEWFGATSTMCER